MARSKVPEAEKHVKMSVSFQPDQLDRVMRYCQKEERAISWVIRKALAEWLDKHAPEE